MSDKPDIEAIRARLAAVETYWERLCEGIETDANPKSKHEIQKLYFAALDQVKSHAPADIAALLAEVARLSAEVSALRERLTLTPEKVEELRLLRELRDAVLNLGNARQWRERANQELVDIPVAPKECMALAIALAALDAAEEGRTP